MGPRGDAGRGLYRITLASTGAGELGEVRELGWINSGARAHIEIRAISVTRDYLFRPSVTYIERTGSWARTLFVAW